jgi:hypothetical protein
MHTYSIGQQPTAEHSAAILALAGADGTVYYDGEWGGFQLYRIVGRSTAYFSERWEDGEMLYGCSKVRADRVRGPQCIGYSYLGTDSETFQTASKNSKSARADGNRRTSRCLHTRVPAPSRP